MIPPMSATSICDYAGYDYKKEFWETQNRVYEDQIERQTLIKLVRASKATPQDIKTYLDAGCGFGRLFHTYEPLAQSFILFDYAQHLLDQAKSTLQSRKPISFVQGDLNQLPFENASVDMIMSVRTLHHLETPRNFLSEAYRILTPGGHFIFEIPNQRHWLNILRFALGRLKQNPFTQDRLQLNTAYFNFHPKFILKELNTLGFEVKQTVNTSFFRSTLLKKCIPTTWLCNADAAFQAILSWVYLTPSVYVLAQKPK